jgi:M6 family metalloprotease-like protein
MKKTLAFSLAISVISGSLALPAYGTAKAGATCKKVGSTSTSGGKKFTCVKSGKKLVWNKGVAVAKPTAPQSQSPDQAPSVAPVQSPVQLPTISQPSSFSQTNECKLSKPSNLNMDDGPMGSVGFPKILNAFPSIGSIKALVLLVDFSDVPATTDLRSPWIQSSIPNAENLFTYSSYGKFNVKVDISEKIYRMKKLSTYYELSTGPYGGPLPNSAPPKIDEVILDAIELADPEVDFSKYAFVAVSTPTSPTLGLSGAAGLGGTTKKFDGITYSYGDFIPLDSLTPLDKPYKTYNFAHDIGHMLGILHPYFTGPNQPNTGAWDIMWNFAYQPDFLGWNKWKLDWITDDQISCLNAPSGNEVIQLLSPIGVAASGKKMIVIKLSATTAIAVEVRRKSPSDDLKPSDEGTIVYTVDTTKSQGQGPFSIVSNPSKTITYQNFPQVLGTLKTGESVTNNGYTISVLQSVTEGDYVSIKKAP